MQDLSPRWAAAAREIARRLQSCGRRAWIVGGAPRDLALGRTPGDVDMASAATPAEIESAFERTIPLGRSFGTVVIALGGVDVQHTTFRSETGYSDARRPDEVAFGETPEEDARRRDFTCNAIYLDPLDDRVLDPEQGLPDLESGILRCVGDPVARFQEDGLRLVRMARFAAALDLSPAPGLLAAAGRSGDALRGVSPERVLVELEIMFERSNSVRALSILVECDLLERVLPGVAALRDRETSPEAWWLARQAVLGALASPPGIALGLAVLCGPACSFGAQDRPPEESTEAAEWNERLEDRALRVTDDLRAPRAVRRSLSEIWRIGAALEAQVLHPATPRSQRVRWMRSESFHDALARVRAWAAVRRVDALALDELVREEAELGADGLHPRALITSQDLEAAGVPRGPLWGQLLLEAETMQLDRALTSRDDALGWLAQRARLRTQEGGNIPRKANESG